MAGRIFAILAAMLLVGAFAIATLAPPDMPLGQAIYMLDRGLLNTAQAGIQRHLSPWLWSGIIVPLLLRPAWLIPAGLGLLCAGAAATLASRQAHRSRRRS